MTGPEQALAAPPGVAERAAADARRNLARIRNRILRFAVLVVLILAIPSLLLSGHISAEWTLAFSGHTSSVLQGEGRAGAISGVIIESLVVLGALLLLTALTRQVYGLTVAGRRWPEVPWLPGISLASQPTARTVGQALLFVPEAGVVPWSHPPASARRPRTALDRSLLVLRPPPPRPGLVAHRPAPHVRKGSSWTAGCTR